MKIISAHSRKQIDQFTIRTEAISSLDLMERAAAQCCDWIIARFNLSYPIYIVVGKGNNGGDGLAIARILASIGYRVVVLIPNTPQLFSDDAQQNLIRLQEQNLVAINYINSTNAIPTFPERAICIDTLFGSGLNRPIEGLLAECLAQVNRAAAIKIAIDIPSGLTDEQGALAGSAVFEANYTLTFEFPFLSFFFVENKKFVGEWTLLSIGLHPDAINQAESNYQYITLAEVKSMLVPRSTFSHKGTFGHVLLLAGSKGMAGASVLAARACLRSGVGKLTVHGPGANYAVVQTAVPEAMFEADVCETHIAQHVASHAYSAIAIGPGVGTHFETVEVLSALIRENVQSLVIDADGLTILSKDKALLDALPAGTILTPHPGEFDRLAGVSSSGLERFQKALAFAESHQVYVVLKGAYTVTLTPQGQAYINSTGNPGMATAGSGDALTGIIAGLLAQKYSPLQACIIGVFLHGTSGDIAAQNLSEQALIASDIVDNIANAYKSLFASTIS